MKIALLGDIAPFGRFCVTQNQNIKNQFLSIRKYLSSFDLVIGNLETPFTLNERAIGGKSATIKAHPKNIELLTSLGITHVTLANNHMGDYGVAAYERTKKCLESVGISWFGTENKQLKITQNGEKIALLGYCSYNTNPSPIFLKSGDCLNYLNAIEVCAAIEQNAHNGFISILAVHSGQEHIHMPSSDDVVFARALARKSDYVYYGHHPHVIQGHENISGSTIFYSLGNFIFDDVYTSRDPRNPLIRLNSANKTGAIGTLEIRDGKIVNSGVTPTYLCKDRVLIGSEVFGFDMVEFDSYLSKAGTPEYDLLRAMLISKYIDGRKKLRNFKWYLRRMNLNSLKIIIKSRKNGKLYQKAFSSKLPLL